MNHDIHISITDRDGVLHNITAPTDMNLNLMEVCKLHELPVKGECGGMAMCGTCQVYVESDHPLPEPSEDEMAMLDQAFFIKNNSRLGCQIHMNPQIDGLIVRLAPENG